MNATPFDKLKRFLGNNGALVALLALVIYNGIKQPEVFLQPENLRNLMNANAAVGMLAVGMTLVIIGGGIDLSVGSMMALVASLGMLALNKVGSEQGAWVALAVCLIAGPLIGLINGVIITAGRIAPFIATLAGLVGFRSIALALAEGGELRSASKELFPSFAAGGVPVPGLFIGPDRPLIIQWPIFIFLLLAAAGSFILNRSRFGRRLIAVGANEQAAIYSGIATHHIKWISYSMLGLCTGIAALCQSSRMNSVTSSQMGLYNELDAIAAVVIGGTSMSGGRGQVWTTVIGVLILGIISNMLVTSGISIYWQGCVKGVIILLAVLLQRGRTAQ